VILDARRPAGGELWDDGMAIGNNFPAAVGNVLLGPGRNHFDVDYAHVNSAVFFSENKPLFNNWTYDSREKTAANLVPPRPDAKARTKLMLIASPWGGGIQQQTGFMAIDDNFIDNTATVNVTARVARVCAGGRRAVVRAALPGHGLRRREPEHARHHFLDRRRRRPGADAGRPRGAGRQAGR
jgi:hypothetical protein